MASGKDMLSSAMKKNSTSPDVALNRGMVRAKDNTPKVQQTQGSMRTLNGSRYGVGGTSKGQGEYDDMPKYNIKSFKKGGMVKKTGIYKLHEGERVIPKHLVSKVTIKKN